MRIKIKVTCNSSILTYLGQTRDLSPIVALLGGPPPVWGFKVKRAVTAPAHVTVAAGAGAVGAVGAVVAAKEKQAATAATLADIAGADSQRIKRNVRVNILNYSKI